MAKAKAAVEGARMQVLPSRLVIVRARLQSAALACGSAQENNLDPASVVKLIGEAEEDLRVARSYLWRHDEDSK